MKKEESSLIEISPDDIVPNPDNPRLIFRERDMIELQESIAEVGIKVPIAVYRDQNKYVLIDGERRWRCALKLNHAKMPAIVQPKPSKLENLLMMFNIHNVKVDWDLMPMALKLKEVGNLLEKEGRRATPKRLAGATGVSLTTVKRALGLLELPNKYKKMLLKEAKKPHDQRIVTVDLFVEINKSRNAIERHTPSVFKSIRPSQYVDAMVVKYTSGVVKNVVKFRDISKIARAELAGYSKSIVIPVLVKFTKTPTYSIEEAFADTVEYAYRMRDLITKSAGLTDRLSKYKSAKRMSKQLKTELRRLRDQITRLLGE